MKLFIKLFSGLGLSLRLAALRALFRLAGPLLRALLGLITSATAHAVASAGRPEPRPAPAWARSRDSARPTARTYDGEYRRLPDEPNRW